MELEERKQVYDKATQIYGHQKQLFQLVEECAEVIKEVNKLNRNNDLNNLSSTHYLLNRDETSINDLCQELADLEIMIEQIDNMSSSGLLRSKIDFYKNIKLERFKEKMDKEEICLEIYKNYN